MAMSTSTPDFSIEVSEVKGLCPAGEVYAKQSIADKKIPVFSCEGACLRGEIARLAANMVTDEVPYARGCYGEMFLVPHSSMTAWVKGAEQVVMIDGCFLKCLGRVLENVIDKERIIHIDAHPLYKEYSDVFLYTDVPEKTRNELARKVADKILEKLREQQVTVN
ncbi:MAG: putative zinc-binding protein [Gammaproteobacteria bacterium]|nr:putative zinc-binding protein [Gammaproteobacteria bacterium]MDH3805169.1 putative zinc-binding protein [Gammaproteobacteria bacterium]